MDSRNFGGSRRHLLRFEKITGGTMPKTDRSETLLEKQCRFAYMVMRLIAHIYSKGYQVTLGDAFRDPRVFGELGVAGVYGNKNTCHKLRLAIDLNLFRDGKYLSSTEAHRQFGEWWELQGGTWGGRFKDGNHYSLEHLGFK